MNPSDSAVISGNQIATYVMGILTWVCSQAAALIPSWSGATTHVIQGGGTVVAAGVLVAGAIHHLADVKKDKTAVSTVVESVEDRLRAQLDAAGIEPKA